LEKSAVLGISSGGVPITIAISFSFVSSISRGSPSKGSPSTPRFRLEPCPDALLDQ